ncbi:YggN family protein [Aliiglaciecola sp. LCG003]|uniref:YggN family protein n=1 Tax=Aliiglaciecola sp. LCG003 TaxID=3053655 RepID=UPI0025732955|nr:YggN family protein [Aliiglaciecola sp. LCG003]WJG09891.1 YggN family protein [Aliiglaciecola sp. LCG003]
MKKTLIATSLVLCSSLALANECNVNIEGNVSLVNEVLTITTDDNDVIAIQGGEQLYVNGKSVELTSQQYEWMSNYYQGVYRAVPEVASIAIEGVAIASTAVTEVFGGLLGADSRAIDDINLKLDEISQKIKYNFYAADGSIQLDSTRFSDGEIFGPQWEEEFSDAVEEVVTSSIGHLMIALGTQMLFSDDDSGDFEQRMETFADDIEQKVEAQAAVLEKRADALCLQLADIDFAENNLQKSVAELSGLDVISMHDGAKRM